MSESGSARHERFQWSTKFTVYLYPTYLEFLSIVFVRYLQHRKAAQSLESFFINCFYFIAGKDSGSTEYIRVSCSKDSIWCGATDTFHISVRERELLCYCAKDFAMKRGENSSKEIKCHVCSYLITSDQSVRSSLIFKSDNILDVNACKNLQQIVYSNTYNHLNLTNGLNQPAPRWRSLLPLKSLKLSHHISLQYQWNSWKDSLSLSESNFYIKVKDACDKRGIMLRVVCIFAKGPSLVDGCSAFQ